MAVINNRYHQSFFCIGNRTVVFFLLRSPSPSLSPLVVHFKSLTPLAWLEASSLLPISEGTSRAELLAALQKGMSVNVSSGK